MRAKRKISVVSFLPPPTTYPNTTGAEEVALTGNNQSSVHGHRTEPGKADEHTNVLEQSKAL
jgi:hypothetical protein